LFIPSDIKTKVLYSGNKISREEVIFLNFNKIHKAYHLEKSKLCGYFGSYHVFQYAINGE
jgi:hypothetical protein